MFSSIALNVVIGLIFIFLLYSLLGTILLEVFANTLNLRAINLEGVLERMLTDRDGMISKEWWRKRVREFVFRLTFGKVDIDKNRKQEEKDLVDHLFDHPNVKGLSRKNVYGKASWIPAPVFAEVLLDVLCRQCNTESIEGLLDGIKHTKLLGKDTKIRLISRLKSVNPDVASYKSELIVWFDDMMDIAGGWYKRNTQRLLMAFGFLIAMSFNVNTIDIARTLAKDTQAAEQIVQLATTSAQMQGQFVGMLVEDSTGATQLSKAEFNQKLQPLFVASLQASHDAELARNILGFGWAKELEAAGNPTSIMGTCEVIFRETFTNFRNLISFLIAALAISLGAPFWFDLLKKIVSIRGGNITSGPPNVVIANGPTGGVTPTRGSTETTEDTYLGPSEEEEVLSDDEITAEEIPEREGA